MAEEAIDVPPPVHRRIGVSVLRFTSEEGLMKIVYKCSCQSGFVSVSYYVRLGQLAQVTEHGIVKPDVEVTNGDGINLRCNCFCGCGCILTRKDDGTSVRTF